MTHVSIIGTGNMGAAISRIMTDGGNTVELFDTSNHDKPVTGQVVILAVPYTALSDVVARRGSQLAGKIVVETTNPVNFETFDELTVPGDASATAELAQALPQSRVVKGFSTNFASTLATRKVGDRVTTVLLAGDDRSAKSVVASIVEAGGLSAVDAGSLSRARELEALGFLQITLAAGETITWTGGFGLVP